MMALADDTKRRSESAKIIAILEHIGTANDIVTSNTNKFNETIQKKSNENIYSIWLIGKQFIPVSFATLCNGNNVQSSEGTITSIRHYISTTKTTVMDNSF